MILEQIEQATGVASQELMKIVVSANYRYRTYHIPKRTGGYRTICHPAPELKYLQRWLNRKIFSQLPIHQSAYAYKKSVGISANAKVHVYNNFFLKIDFKDFFPSLKKCDVEKVLKNRRLLWDDLTDADIEIILKIVCKEGALTIGAPSSPILSNALLYEFDCHISELCSSREIVYSRYADDLFLSTKHPNILSSTLQLIRDGLKTRQSPKLKINEKKTIYTSRKRKRMAAGLVLTSDKKLSIGRKKKREIRTLVHLYSQNKISLDSLSYLCGYLAFVKSVEPEFLQRISNKFGKEVIDNLNSVELVQRKHYDENR